MNYGGIAFCVVMLLCYPCLAAWLEIRAAKRHPNHRNEEK